METTSTVKSPKMFGSKRSADTGVSGTRKKAKTVDNVYEAAKVSTRAKVQTTVSCVNDL